MKTYIGIDNGKKGAIVIISDDNQIISKYPMPMVGTTKKDYDVPMIVECLAGWEADMVMLEKVFTMPTIPRGTAQSLGRCLGLMEGICASLKYPYAVVSPKEWQKTVLAGLDRKDTKAASILFAKRMWPKEDWKRTIRSRKDDDNITDAACLALYAKMRYGT